MAKVEVSDFPATMTGASVAETAPALSIPAYLMADLPWAASFRNSLVIVKDDPQGMARSVPVGADWHWISEVDGSDLGVGNAAS